jgi:hypothetical protein
VYIDGSFVTAKDKPNDYDACWDVIGVDHRQLDPVLRSFNNRRAGQKAKYFGELFPAAGFEKGTGLAWLGFFQTDKNTGNPKGIIGIDLRSAQL